jgi:hypothetical protein
MTIAHKNAKSLMVARFFTVYMICVPVAHAVQVEAVIPTANTITRMSGESDENFFLRKQRITYGTVENKKECEGYLQISIGLCKGGSEAACFTKDLYKAWCVAPNEDADLAVTKLPTRSREDFFDYREGRWLTRVEYCAWLQQQPARRGATWRRDLYERNCKSAANR